jgi:Acetyltransferase (GNAT) family
MRGRFSQRGGLSDLAGFSRFLNRLLSRFQFATIPRHQVQTVMILDRPLSAPPALTLTDTPPPGMFRSMFRTLEAYTMHRLGPMRPRLLAIPVHDEAGAVAGGLWGNTVYHWLYIQLLVVPEDRRGQGLGMMLLDRAEQEARDRGCIGAYVTTFTAPGFYERCGYTLFGTLRDCPPGYDLCHFRKEIEQPAAPDPRALAALLEQTLTRARELAAGGDTDAALAAYSEVIRLDPTHMDALTEIGELAWARGHRTEARAIWLRAMRRRLAGSFAVGEPA